VDADEFFLYEICVYCYVKLIDRFFLQPSCFSTFRINLILLTRPKGGHGERYLSQMGAGSWLHGVDVSPLQRSEKFFNYLAFGCCQPLVIGNVV
jgi:hypothetical protein